MTHLTDKPWSRILLILLCAALAAGGAFFASCFGYARVWRTGGSEDFADSDFAHFYVDDCMDYLMRFANWMGYPTETAASGYGRDSFGCVLLRDGNPVFDTTMPDAVLMNERPFYRYEETLVEGSADEYNAALERGEYIEAPDGGMVVYAMPASNIWFNEATGQAALEEASGEASEETPELVLLGVEYEYVLQGYLNYPILPYSGLYAEYSFWMLMRDLKDWALPLAIVLWTLAAALAFTLARDARRRKAAGAGLLTRMPFDAFAVGVIVLSAVLSLALRSLGERLLIGATKESWLLIDVLIRFLARMIRAFVWTAAGAILLRAGLARSWRRGENLLFDRLSAEVRVLFSLGLGMIFAVLGIRAGNNAVILVGLALILLGGVFAALLFRQLRKLRKVSARLAAGDLDVAVEAGRFWPGVCEQAEALNRIGGGIKTAVEEQLRGERLKTELITNVSHDLKTPITSIVSCAELLKKPDITGEQAAEYVEMLDRQCRKLKKLTDDLIEASKASSGAIDVNREPTDVRELLNQSVGEFSERLAERRITPVLTLPETPCVMDTDGQLLWRILDNLLGNICKYAQPDTRAYIDLETSAAETVISLKNVSESSLNISAETLMERFVRGDASRSTEGSGLGLSIAQSLARLLGGELALSVDGDLFKAVLRFENKKD